MIAKKKKKGFPIHGWWGIPLGLIVYGTPFALAICFREFIDHEAVIGWNDLLFWRADPHILWGHFSTLSF